MASQQNAPIGFFEVSTEDAAAEAALMAGDHDGFKPILKSRLDAVNRDKEEEKERKKDATKLKRKREDNLPDALQQLARLNDPAAIAKRGRLMLPAPQVTDRELEDVVKASSVCVHCML